MSNLPRCCLTTPDPGRWTAGVDDTADPGMIRVMHTLRDKLSYQMPIRDLILACNGAIQIDSRTMLGGDLQRCILSNAAHRLEALAEHIDPSPWRTRSQSLRDAWAVLCGRAVAIYVSGTVLDRPGHRSNAMWANVAITRLPDGTPR